MATARWLAAALLLAMSPTAGHAGTTAPLNNQELRSELIGRAIAWFSEGSFFHGELHLDPDGRAEITMENPIGYDRGVWRLDANQLCTRWVQSRDGQEKCYFVERLSDGRFVTTGGNTFEIRAPSM